MEIKRVFDLLQHQLEQFPQTDALAYKQHGSWIKYSTQDIIEIVDSVSHGLLKMGIKNNDKIAIISQNRPEWNFIDLGVQQIGAITVPIYPTITIEDYEYIFRDAGVRLIFVEGEELEQKASEASRNLPEVEKIYTFDEIPGVAHWSEVKQLGLNGDIQQLNDLRQQVRSSDLLTLIYTSGTTGDPKGVMLTHDNIISNAKAVSKISTLDGPNCRSLSFLPLCHIFERTAIYYYLLDGISVYYAESLDTIAQNLQEIAPDTFTTVPRLLEKVYEKIISKGYELSGIKKNLFFWALNLGLKYDPNKKFGGWYRFQLNLANKIIFKKWREALGGNIKFITSGAAALQPRLCQVFWAAEIKVLEAYGLTETSPGISFSTLEEMRVGCVGVLLDKVQVKIANDGEILVKGPNVMKGYFNKAELTKQAIDDEGWFHTGDIGQFIEGKFLKITDRKKEIFKTSGGKYIAPQVIENVFKESNLIEQIMVTGEGEKFPSALIVPNFDRLKEWCLHKGISYTTDDQIVEEEFILEKFETEISKYNQSFAQYEKIKKFQLLSDSWDITSGELTPTMKLKRKVIKEKYLSIIKGFYINNE
ncbi:long-chain fatty acid--CoA ligase [Fulvivirgaceae bacterium BMA10]|uniref:Long-chain fatty acid--CoA ligase n=1 Tax=Splendidivirga corallicola TaxID=3051826 RepID=A0ABT8KMU7_9BACT|nr:long-chain fatty acid--CoA ligase [Fulvivirgaceae bacterium BMA10]